jgi:hypothetical protein
MKKILSLHLLLFSVVASLAQMPSVGFAVKAGGETRDQGKGIAADPFNNYYVTGYFEGSMTFAGASTITLNSAGNYDIFLAKYSTSGQALWAFRLGTSTDDRGNKVTTDASGNVYLTGYYTGTIDLDPGAGVATHSFAGGEDFFIAKYDPNGNYLWSKSYGGTDVDECLDIKADDSGNLIAVGSFRANVDFNPGGTPDIRTSVGSSDLFIMKLDASGNLIFVHTFGSSSSDAASAIAIDSDNNLIISGSFRNTVDFDQGAGVSNLTSAGSNDIFLAKYNNNGDFLWALGGGNSGSDGTYSVAVDGADNVYLTGYFQNIIDGDFTAGVNNLNSAGNRDILIAKYSPNGSFLWARNIGGADEDRCFGVVALNDGSVIVTGYFTGTADFDPGPAFNNIVSNGFRDVFVAKYTASGNLEWAFGMGADEQDEGYGIALDGFENIVVTGFFHRQVDFDPGVGVLQLTSSGPAPPVLVSDDVYIAKYSSRSLSASVTPTSPSCYAGNNGSAVVDVIGGIAPYNIFWSTGVSGNSISGLSPGNYFVTVTDAVGIQVVTNFTITAPVAPEICLVTVDSTTATHNTIVWEKSGLDLAALDSFFIYREISIGNFQKIGAVHKDSLSQFDDFAVNTGTTFYFYKLSALDTCGSESALSLYHKTIHLLTIGGGQFQWSFYEIESTPNQVGNYLVFRDDNNSGNFQLLADGTISGSSNVYTDVNAASFPDAKYRIEVDWLNALQCTSVRAINHNTTRSNKTSTAMAPGNVTELLDKLIQVYPNPSTGMFTVNSSLSNGLIIVRDALGREIHHQQINSTTSFVNLENQSNGIYFMELRSSDMSKTVRVVVAK